jgi:hypothetical protein
MKSTRILVVAAAATMLAGCQSVPDSAFREQRPATATERSSVAEFLKLFLADPYSIRGAEISSVLPVNGVPAVCFRVNAKNAFGAYTGQNTYAAELSSYGSVKKVVPDDNGPGGCGNSILRYGPFPEAEHIK